MLVTAWEPPQRMRIVKTGRLLAGWAEITVVVRFWLISALFVAVGVGFFYLEWINQ